MYLYIRAYYIMYLYIRASGNHEDAPLNKSAYTDDTIKMDFFVDIFI